MFNRIYDESIILQKIGQILRYTYNGFSNTISDK